jgi:hypothetical protein
MRFQWTIAMLLSSALIAGCGGRGNDNSNKPEENGTAPTAGAAADNREAVAETSAPAVDDSSSASVRPAPRPSAPAKPLQPRGTNVVAGTVDRPSNRADQSPAPAPRVTWRELTINSGTSIPLELMTPLSSETAQVETPVRARLRQDLVVDGLTAIPSGSVVTGTVTEVERPGRVQGRAHLAFRFNEVQVNGAREDLRTNPISFEGEATKGEDATKIGAGAGVGAIIGGIVGGKKGAAKGGAIGGAAGTGAVLATRGKDVEIAGGADITATLAQPTTIRVQVP